jgi:hypothetical protein
MSRRPPDWVDMLCIAWAEQRRKALGIILPKMLEPHERLGKLTCTLGAVRDEGEGAAYSGKTQNWPEVYLGDALLVHRCWCGMPRPWAEVMHVHYVWRELSAKSRIDLLLLDFTEYYSRLNLLKVHVDNYVKSTENWVKPVTVQWVRYKMALDAL